MTSPTTARPTSGETIVSALRDLGPGGHTLRVNGVNVGWAHEYAASFIEYLQAEVARLSTASPASSETGTK